MDWSKKDQWTDKQGTQFTLAIPVYAHKGKPIMYH